MLVELESTILQQKDADGKGKDRSRDAGPFLGAACSIF